MGQAGAKTVLRRPTAEIAGLGADKRPLAERGFRKHESLSGRKDAARTCRIASGEARAWRGTETHRMRSHPPHVPIDLGRRARPEIAAACLRGGRTCAALPR